MSDKPAETMHTEGPWSVCTDAIGNTFVASMTDSAETICELGSLADGEAQTRLEADARLIAAAPALLEALKTLTEIVDDQLDGDFPEALQAAITAIFGDET